MSRTCETPNLHAPPPRASLYPGIAVVTGYQSYVVTASRISPANSDVKSRLLEPWLSRRFLHGRSVLDLGCNGGFHSFSSIQQGAAAVTAVDIDEDYLALVRSVRDHLGYDRLEVEKANVADWSKPADIVIALALVHWIYSCSAVLGSLDSVVLQLSKLSRHMLVTEWVGPDDPAIHLFGHLGWNPEAVAGPYTFEAFEEALRARFARVYEIGSVNPTRRLFAAFQEPHELDLSDPLPTLAQAGRVIASRNLIRLGGIDHWSRVHLDPAGGGSVVKQTSLDLGYRESLFLKALSGPYFPRVLGASLLEDFSTVEIERIDGVPLERGASDLASSLSRYLEFVGHCLNILSALRAQGITHRDIGRGNILLRGGMPVLIDFGWAVSEQLPMSAPAVLGLEGRPPDGGFCDVYSMGKVLAWVKGDAYPELDAVVERMVEPEARLRVTDTSVLGYLFSVAGGELRAPREKGPMSAGNESDPAPEEAVRQLLRQVSALTQRVRALEAQVTGSSAELTAQRDAFGTASTRLLELQGEAERLAEKTKSFGGVEALLLEAERREADLVELRGHADRVETALAAARGLVAAQSSRVVYLENEVNARLWRKVLSYARRKLRSR